MTVLSRHDGNQGLGIVLAILIGVGLPMVGCGDGGYSGQPQPPQPTDVPQPTASPAPPPEPTAGPGPDCEIVETTQSDGSTAEQVKCRCANSSNFCDFDVRLVFSDNAAVKPLAYSYSLDAVPGHNPDDWRSNDKKLFDYLETAQFRVEQGTPVALWVNDTRDTNAAPCMAVYNQSRNPVYLKLGGSPQDSANQYALVAGQVSDLGSAPIHLTLIPYNNGGGSCGPPNSPLEAGRALAVWIDRKSFSGPFDCDIKADVEEAGYTDGANCEIKSYWQFVPPSGGGPAYVEHRGSLYDMVGKALPGNELRIHIREGASVNTGLSTGFVRLEVASGFEDACRKVVDSINSSGFQATQNKSSCKISGIPQTYTRRTDKKIIVTGFGRINGWEVLNRYGPKTYDRTKDGPFDFARWEIDVQLLNLSSAYPTSSALDASIDVSHITLAFPPKRGVGAVTLNTGDTPFPDDRDANNLPVKMYDFKQAGGWIDQADGPEIMAEKSLIEFSYIHSNDDAVKISANNVRYDYSTLLHGDAGGAVNIGSYGKNRTVANSSIDGIYIHRITNAKIENDDGAPSWSGTRGVIISRTCPEKARVDSPGNANRVTGVTINDVFIPSLGDSQGPNSIGALFSLGVSAARFYPGDALFCDTNNYVDTFDFGDFTFTSFRVYPNPLNKSFLYNHLGGNNVRVNWHPIRFCKSPNGTSCEQNGASWPDAVQIYPASQSSEYYYVCGQEGVAAQHCWNSAGENGVSTNLGGTSNNVQYYSDGANVFDGIVVNPYTP